MAYHYDYMQTFSGRKLSFVDPQPEDILIVDIAHHLSMISRFAGATIYPYSVGQHSINAFDLVELVAPSHSMALRREALLHDGVESYVNDLVSPFKAILPGYRDVENRIHRVIADKFDVPFNMSAAVKEVDARLLVTEAATLLPGVPGVTKWWEDPHWPEPFDEGRVWLSECGWRRIKTVFLKCCEEAGIA